MLLLCFLGSVSSWESIMLCLRILFSGGLVQLYMYFQDYGEVPAQTIVYDRGKSTTRYWIPSKTLYLWVFIEP